MGEIRVRKESKVVRRRAWPVATALTEILKLACPISSAVHQRPALWFRRELQQLLGKRMGDPRHPAQGENRNSAPLRLGRDYAKWERKGREESGAGVLILILSPRSGRFLPLREAAAAVAAAAAAAVAAAATVAAAVAAAEAAAAAVAAAVEAAVAAAEAAEAAVEAVAEAVAEAAVAAAEAAAAVAAAVVAAAVAVAMAAAAVLGATG